MHFLKRFTKKLKNIFYQTLSFIQNLFSFKFRFQKFRNKAFKISDSFTKLQTSKYFENNERQATSTPEPREKINDQETIFP